MFGEAGIGLGRQRFDVGQGRRCQSPPIVEMACHDNVVGEVLTPTKRLTEWHLMGNVWLSLREACMRMTTTSLALAGVLLALTLGTAARARPLSLAATNNRTRASLRHAV